MAKVHKPTLTQPIWPDTGRQLGISKNTAYEAAKRGEIPTVRIGRRLLVPIAALERLLNGE